MSIISYADRIGTADGTDLYFTESIYLLNEAYVITGLRPATEQNAPAPRIGDSFFTHFPASREELATLDRTLKSLNEDSLLIQAGERPVLILCRFFARTRMLVAVVPQHDVRALLEAPAAFADVLEQMHVRLSGQTRVAAAPWNEQGYPLLSSWLRRIHTPLFFGERESGRFDTKTNTVVSLLCHLALLCGCRLDYDLTGFDYAPFDATDLSLLIGTAFCVFFMTHRVAKDKAVIIKGTRLSGHDPILHVLLNCDAAIDTLSEIEVLYRKAPERADLFHAFHCPNESFSLQLQFSFCNKEISMQELKTSNSFERDPSSFQTCSISEDDIKRFDQDTKKQ